MAVSEYAALSPQVDPLGGWHSRAGDPPLARENPATLGLAASGHHDGPDGDDSRGGRRNGSQRRTGRGDQPASDSRGPGATGGTHTLLANERWRLDSTRGTVR